MTRTTSLEARIEARVYEKCLRVFDVAAARHPIGPALCEVRSIFSTLMLAADPTYNLTPPAKPAKIPIYVPKKPAAVPASPKRGRPRSAPVALSPHRFLPIPQRKEKMLDMWAEGTLSQNQIADTLELKRGSVSAWLTFAREAGDPRAAKRTTTPTNSGRSE